MLNLNARQQSILGRLNSIIDGTEFFIPLAIEGGGALLANKFTTYFDPPTDGHWMDELENWFSIGLLSLQLQTAQYAMDLSPTMFSDTVQTPNENDSWMCNSQIIYRDDYISFNVLGLTIIILVGGFLVVLSLCLDLIMKKVN